jgi:glycosyltransferase involved in cell wall biosynthesis
VKVVALVEKSPVPDTTGHRRRLLRLLTALDQRFDTSILLVTRSLDTDDRIALAASPLAPLDVVTLSPRRIRPSEVPGWVAGRGLPLAWARTDAPAARATIAARVAALDPDVVFATSSALAAAFLRDTPVPVVLDVAHVERTAIDRQLRAFASPSRWSSLRPRRDALLAVDRRARLATERRALLAAAWTTPCSDVERDAIARIGPTPATIVPNGVDVPDNLVWAPGSRRMLLIANFGYAPNAEAARVLAAEVLPKVRLRYPAAAVVLVGPGSTDVDVGPVRDGVVRRGVVDDVGEAYAQAEVAVAPLRSGSGSKLKTLEALAYGVPLVTTPVGVEGIPVEAGHHARVGTTVDELADHVVALFGDATAAEAQRDAARRWVAERYSWSTIGDRLCATLADVARSSPSG